MQRQQAPFRADIVGSFLRPDSIKQARQQLAEGIIDAAQLREIENNAIRHLVQQQCDCGLHVVTDGEFRRAWWHFDFFDGLQGVERYDAEQGIQFNGVQTKAHGVRVTGKLAFGDHPMLEDFRYLKSISGDAQPKMTIPSPSVLHFRGGRKDIDATVYPDLSDYFDDLATTWRDAIRAFYDAGCRYLQLDDTVWAYLCSDAQRQQVRERGEDPVGTVAHAVEDDGQLCLFQLFPVHVRISFASKFITLFFCIQVAEKPESTGDPGRILYSIADCLSETP